jgi:hypothetical protein
MQRYDIYHDKFILSMNENFLSLFSQYIESLKTDSKLYELSNEVLGTDLKMALVLQFCITEGEWNVLYKPVR